MKVDEILLVLADAHANPFAGKIIILSYSPTYS